MLLNIAIQRSGKLPPSSAGPTSDTTSATTQPVATQDVNRMTTSIRTPSVKPRNLEKGRPVITDILDTVVAALLEQEPTLNFKPEDQSQSLTINMLPGEILLEILHMLDPSSIETFALVCRKARVLTLESSIWR